MALVDLTQPFSDGMFGLSTLPRITVEKLRTIPENGVNVTRIDCAVHSGTHIDAPCHFISDGRDASELALTDTCGDAVGISIACEPEEEIGLSALESAVVHPGDIVFIHTGWGELFSTDPARYHHHPYLSEDAAQWLVSRQAKMVALDVPTPDRPEALRPDGFDFPVHHILLGADVLVAEHLTGLAQVTGRRSRAMAFPLPIRHADGSPVRFVAEI